MIKKKNKVWTFLFSLLPGAGEMYMGFMRQGISLMGLFFGLIFCGAFLDIGIIWIFLPIVWFYSFFNVHNINSLSDEEFYALEDEYIFPLGQWFPKKKWGNQEKKAVAIAMIVLGASILWVQAVEWIRYYIRPWLPEGVDGLLISVFEALPQLVIAFALIVVGVKMIKGKKAQLDQEEEPAKIEEQAKK